MSLINGAISSSPSLFLEKRNVVVCQFPDIIVLHISQAIRLLCTYVTFDWTEQTKELIRETTNKKSQPPKKEKVKKQQQRKRQTKNNKDDNNTNKQENTYKVFQFNHRRQIVPKYYKSLSFHVEYTDEAKGFLSHTDFQKCYISNTVT